MSQGRPAAKRRKAEDIKYLAKQSFFAEDTCAVKGEPYKVGVVDRTWRDVDQPGTFSDLEDLVRGGSIPISLVKEFLASGAPPRDYVLVKFIDTKYGSSLLPESSLELLDR
ncbi:MAG: hypothetical protein M1830_002301, partial [Pleopsidium flavum]